MPDMGHYPFGSRFFTNLLHYTRSGDFVEALIRDARNVHEYAFALGALAHYVADSTGHPRGVNRAVAMPMPRNCARAISGTTCTYAEDPKRHVRVEFAFDVVQVARGSYLPQAYRDFIGFEIAKHLVERAFRETCGLGDEGDLRERGPGDWHLPLRRRRDDPADDTGGVGTQKRNEIEELAPHVDRNAFVYVYPPNQCEEDFGTTYDAPACSRVSSCGSYA